MKTLIRDIAIVLVVVLAITFFIKPIIVKKTSMEPTLTENNYLFISKQAYRFGEPERGDIIVFPHYTGGEKELYIKRVIGLPGETIETKDGEVYVDGEAIKEDYIKDVYTAGQEDSIEVPKGQLYVLGDNREVSIDSRYAEVGTVDIDEVTGKAILRVYPFGEFGTL